LKKKMIGPMIAMHWAKSLELWMLMNILNMKVLRFLFGCLLPE